MSHIQAVPRLRKIGHVSGPAPRVPALEGSMPRHSPFEICLTPDEGAELRRRARSRTLEYRKVIRAKMILLAAEGLGNDEIATRLETRREVVSRWRKRFYENRLPGLEKRSGH